MMDKTYLEKHLDIAKSDYIWTLYFFNSRKQRNAGYIYESHKVRFTNNQNLYLYAGQVIHTVTEFQLAPVNQVEVYNGFNTKCSCDRLDINIDIIATNFSVFQNSLANAIEADVNDSYKGYILEGQPQHNINGEVITFMKFANPTAKLKTKKSILYKKSEDNSLDEVTEQFFRMYLTVDAILIDGNLYAFNHSFEKIFDVKQTLHKVKEKAIEEIVNAGFISDPDVFKTHAQSTNSRTFITLKDERIQRATASENRIEISNTLQIPLDGNGLFDTATQEQSNLLIKYLCYKVFKESETSELLEASNVSKLNVGDTTS